jgi:E3 ubiquitin-protein ligase HUWE1
LEFGTCNEELIRFIKRHQVLILAITEADPRILLGSLDFIVMDRTLSTPFQGLVKGLSFEEKQTWLREKIHQEQAKCNFKGISIVVPRNNIFQGSCGLMFTEGKDATASLKGEFNVRFEGEDGVGAGIRREWFRVLAAEMFNPDTALFKASGNTNTFQPNPKSYINPGTSSCYISEIILEISINFVVNWAIILEITDQRLQN